MIVPFGVGLAGVLIVIGVLLVRSRSLVERVDGLGSRRSRGLLTLGGTVIVTGLGVGMTLNGLSGYLR